MADVEGKEELVKISVRNLVEFILREGDIDNRIAGSMEKDAMQQGSRIHRKIQRQMGSDYHAEISLKTRIPCDGFVLQVEGRADGIIENETGTTIDEIKGVVKELIHIEKPAGVHLAQAKCYAYIYGTEKELEQIQIQMTYCNLDSEEIKRFKEQYTLQSLKEWFFELIEKYEKWARFQILWREKRDCSIKNVEFPFPYREGQREITASVYRTILRKKKLFIQASTGVGKTMAAVFPAVRAVGEGLGQRIFYLTAKTITRTVAEQAFQTLKEQGLSMKVITLTAKEKICFCEDTICNPDHCPYARGHYDRVNDAVFDMLQTANDMSREALETQAKKFEVCPFEMALDVSSWSDVIICDYNYVFDPNAHLKRFFYEGNKGEYLFLIDEAHNLVERGREMYSATLCKEDVLAMKRLVKNDNVKLAGKLEECNKQLLAIKRECEHFLILESVSHIAIKLMNIMAELEEYMEELQDEGKRDLVLEFYFQIRDFLNIHDLLDENYVLYSELERGGHFKVKLFCVNPSENLRAYLEQGNSTIFFSATLLPIQYYKSLLSVEPEDYAIYAQSSFPKENRLVMLGTDVSTKYTKRSVSMYTKFARYILETVRRKKGNYMVFFPSYSFLEEVFQQFEMLLTKQDQVECIMQSQFMGEEAREIFLENFEEERQDSLVGFCVMGGIFSEGIDLTNDRLIGAIVIGTGIPQVCNEREILKEHFDRRTGNGFDYAYLYPGINKVLQSAGRVIRTDTDQGVILLLDERFLGRRYRDIFPREWESCLTCTIENVGNVIEQFWDTQREI